MDAWLVTQVLSSELIMAQQAFSTTEASLQSPHQPTGLLTSYGAYLAASERLTQGVFLH